MLMGSLIGASVFGLLLAAGNLSRVEGDNLAALAYVAGAGIFIVSIGAIIGSFM